MEQATIGKYFFDLVNMVQRETGLVLKPSHYSDSVISFTAEFVDDDISVGLSIPLKVAQAQVVYHRNMGIGVTLGIYPGNLTGLTYSGIFLIDADCSPKVSYEDFARLAFSTLAPPSVQLAREGFYSLDHFKNSVRSALQLFQTMVPSINFLELREVVNESVGREAIVEKVAKELGLRW